MTIPQARIAQWLRASRPDTETQEWLAADIRRVTGWNLTRDRYSKYESGSLPVGPKVLRHFVDYWQTRGVPGPEVQSEAPATVTETGVSDYLSRIDALVAQIAVQADAITALAAQVKALTERPSQDAELMNTMAATVALAVQTTLQASGFFGEPRQS